MGDSLPSNREGNELFRGCHTSQFHNSRSNLLAAREALYQAISKGFSKIVILTEFQYTSAVMAGRDILPWNISVVAEDLSQWKKQGIIFYCMVVDQRIVDHIRQWANEAAYVFCY